jgi:two-component system, cell cycle response regulator
MRKAGGSLQILIADDSLVSRHLLDATLRKWGYEVVIACDGAEAWDIMQQNEAPPLAILDWMMPGMTGPEVCRLVRQRAREPYTYILLLTSKSLKEELIEGMESGADDYIIKPFDQHELKVRLRAGTRLVELQAQLLSAREALREQATKDSLTRLWNRSSIIEIMERELSRGLRENTPIGVVLLDLDHFKVINDTYGHVAGDAALREAGRRMLNSTRQYDSLGRYGGEEFLLIFPGCNAQATIDRAERLRANLCTEPLLLTDTAVTLTASFGATSIIPGIGINSEGLIRTADEALYRAKRLGRNRVEYLAERSGQPMQSLILAAEPAIL